MDASETRTSDLWRLAIKCPSTFGGTNFGCFPGTFYAIFGTPAPCNFTDYDCLLVQCDLCQTKYMQRKYI
jgi:hypothetical protein